VEGADSGVYFDALVSRVGAEDSGIGSEIDGGGTDGGEEGGGEFAWVEAVLIEEEKTVIAGGELWKESAQFLRCEGGACVGYMGRQSLQRGAGVEGHDDAGESAEAFEEGRVEAEAQVGEGEESGWVVGVRGGEHSSGGGGRLGERGPLLDNGSADAAAVEFKREREADDACAGDADIRMLH
jgi:hypothetical protein